MENQDHPLTEKINNADSLENLSSLYQQTSHHFRTISLSVHTILEDSYELNATHDLLMRKAVKLVYQAFNHKHPDTPLALDKIAVFLMGSGARKEQTLNTDQDNGIIYTDFTESEGQNHSPKVLAQFSELLNKAFKDIGYRYCPGNVMASNPRWQQSLTGWEKLIQHYASSGELNDIKYLSIASDMRLLNGNSTIFLEARNKVSKEIVQKSSILKSMQEQLKYPQIPLSFWGHIYTDRFGEHSGEIDIKNGLYVPLVNTIKFLAIYFQMPDYSTSDRLQRLKNIGVIPSVTYDKLYFSLKVSIYFRLLLSFHHPHHAYIKPSDLEPRQRDMLKEALKIIKEWQKTVIKWKGDSVNV